MTVRGIDVSAIQGKPPWAAIARAGVSFAYLRCQVGNDYKDALYAADVAGARAAGIVVGAYSFAYPLPHIDPLDAARMFFAAAGVPAAGIEAGTTYALGARRGELPPALDLEWPPPEQWAKWGCTAGQIAGWSLACLGEMALLWEREPIVYSYPWWLRALAQDPACAALSRYRLWIAGGPQYKGGDGRVPDLAREHPPEVPLWGGTWTLWQHDGDGGLRLPNGADADFNVFRGDQDAFDAFCNTVPVPEAPSTIAVPPIEEVVLETNALILEDQIAAYRRERDNG